MCIADTIYKGVCRDETDIAMGAAPSYEMEQEAGDYAPNRSMGVVHQYF